MRPSENKIRVLHVVDNLDQGGIESYLMNIIRAYDRCRFQMDFCYKGQREGAMAQEVRDLGSNVAACPMVFDQIRFIHRFVKLLKTKKYDIVDSHICELSGPVVYAAALTDVPVKISSYHNTANTSMEGLVKKLPFLKPVRNCYMSFCHKAVLKYSDKITGCSTAALDAYFPDRDPSDQRYKVLYYGIDVERFAKGNRQKARELLEIPDSCQVVGHIGRFNLPKDHRTFVKAAEIISKKIPGIKFLLVGDGYLKPQIEQMVDEIGLADRFLFTGIRSDIPDMLSAMDCMLFPSIAEGFGLVAIEAQAAGVPVVASDLPGIKEALCKSMRDMTVKPGQVELFAENTVAVLSNAEMHHKLQLEGLQFVAQDFSQQAATRNLSDFYEEIIRQK